MSCNKIIKSLQPWELCRNNNQLHSEEYALLLGLGTVILYKFSIMGNYFFVLEIVPVRDMKMIGLIIWDILREVHTLIVV